MSPPKTNANITDDDDTLALVYRNWPMIGESTETLRDKMSSERQRLLRWEIIAKDSVDVVSLLLLT